MHDIGIIIMLVNEGKQKVIFCVQCFVASMGKKAERTDINIALFWRRGVFCPML